MIISNEETFFAGICTLVLSPRLEYSFKQTGVGRGGSKQRSHHWSINPCNMHCWLDIYCNCRKLPQLSSTMNCWNFELDLSIDWQILWDNIIKLHAAVYCRILTLEKLGAVVNNHCIFTSLAQVVTKKRHWRIQQF